MEYHSLSTRQRETRVAKKGHLHARTARGRRCFLRDIRTRRDPAQNQIHTTDTHAHKYCPSFARRRLVSKPSRSGQLQTDRRTDR